MSNTVTIVQHRRDGTKHTIECPLLMKFWEHPIPERGVVEVYRLDMQEPHDGGYVYVFDHERPYEGEVQVRPTTS